MSWTKQSPIAGNGRSTSELRCSSLRRPPSSSAWPPFCTEPHKRRRHGQSSREAFSTPELLLITRLRLEGAGSRPGRRSIASRIWLRVVNIQYGGAPGPGVGAKRRFGWHYRNRSRPVGCYTTPVNLRNRLQIADEFYTTLSAYC